MNLISTTDAAEQKGVTRQAIVKAVGRGEIDAHKVSTRSLVVIANKKFETWQPDLTRQASGLTKRKPSKKARK